MSLTLSGGADDSGDGFAGAGGAFGTCVDVCNLKRDEIDCSFNSGLNANDHAADFIRRLRGSLGAAADLACDNR